ncbi:MAG: DHH family phosphoesterase, partial [Chloroflexi bacterium]|nr:DHH family phosphoesterase [Chloroflexota bacterium]
MAERWILRRTPSPAFLQKVPDLHPLLAKVLYARKFDTPEAARAFLMAPKAMGDPFALPDMPTAIERIRQAIARHERIAIYGDFDADGITATALLVSALGRLGAEVIPYIPDRFDEGYGLNKGALEALRRQGIGLVITVDCGIRSPDEARYAREIGLDLIITDH